MKKRIIVRIFLSICFLFNFSFVFANKIGMEIKKPFLNIPIGDEARMKLVNIIVDGEVKREFPVQLAEDSIDYWIYIDVSEFIGQTITLSCPATSESLTRIYQDDRIVGADSLYNESNRPQYHLTVKRGWSNDINGPIYHNNQYHLFWQSFPFGLKWNTGFMYWGHAVSKDLLHWEELPHALMLDSLGSPWSGSAVVDKNNDGGWGKDALVLYYTAFDRVSGKQVQCIAYSIDDGKTFTRYKGNPIIDSNQEMGTNHTRDPKVFWHDPTKHWVMVLFEDKGMSFYNSKDMKKWQKQSHFTGLHECPDFFELPVDGDSTKKKWVIHGGSPEYFVGDFNGKTFTPTSEKLRYAEGIKEGWGDIVYAALTFENMPNDRRVQIAWGRVQHPGMPFTQMMLFPTEFSLKTTDDGIRLFANPIKEIEELHLKKNKWSSLTLTDANNKLKDLKQAPLHVKIDFTLDKGKIFRLRYLGTEILNLSSDELPEGQNKLEILLDKTVAEIFLNNGARYIVKEVKDNNIKSKDILVFDSLDKYGPTLKNLEVYEMKSIWKN